MAWSTSEIADLASTTVNTVRHYHRLGLLPEPERRMNGYKRYGVPHLVRLLRIRRLVDLGLPLSQVGPLGDEPRPEALRDVDAQLAAAVERIQQARAAIAAILRVDAPADSPTGFEAVASRLSETDRAILHISGQLYDADAMADLRRMVEVDEERYGVGRQIDGLAADADEATRERLAGLLAPVLALNLTEYPWLLRHGEHLSRSERIAGQTLSAAIAELYNPAQRDVLSRASTLAHELLQRADASVHDAPAIPGPSLTH